MDTKNPLSAMSYTNKDFSTIFVELLDLVKELSSKWDPTISNESDPGVILLKVNAIIADKNNYNIDKNILEAFPETVTQLENARNMYKQLAYNMAWYNAAKTTVMFKWLAEIPEGVVAEIPRYTMLTNEDASVIFTTLNSVEFTASESVTSVEAIQGSIVTHAVNGSSTVSLAHLDSNNRLYLNDYSVAENGVFITNADEKDTDLWTKVDNLQVRTKGNKFYEFGVDVRKGVCYIEFPEDISDLIGTGLTVRYILTSGASGNVNAKELDRFFDEISIDVGGESMSLTAENVQLYNSVAAVDGADPEDVSSAYKNYKKTAGTFDTLVTLRDYVNAIYNSGIVSNCQVCDRYNDPQSAYQVITDDDASPIQIYQASNEDNAEIVSYAKLKDTTNIDATSNMYFVYDSETHSMVPYTSSYQGSSIYYRYSEGIDKDLSAFDLRMYLLQDVGTVQNITQYYDSFKSVPSDSATQKKVLGYISEQKCVSHDFKDIIPNQFFMFKNSYPIGIKIVPQYRLQETEIESVKANINSALRKLLNSRQVEFGVEPSYDIIYDTISNSDERIKVVILDDFVYTTFATYWDDVSKEFKDIPISNSSSPLIVNVDKYADFNSKAKELVANKRKDILTSAYFYSEEGKPFNINDTTAGDAGYAVLGAFYKYDKLDGGVYKFKEYSRLRDVFRRQVVAKSILAGKTPLFKQEDKFEYSIDQEHIDAPSTDRATTNLIVSPFAQQTTNENDAFVSENVGSETFIYPKVVNNTDGATVAKYTLKENESIRFLAPSFSTLTSYSNYVKFEFVKGESSGDQLIKLNPSNYKVVEKAKIHLTDYKNLVTYDIVDFVNSSVAIGAGYNNIGNALRLNTEVDAQPVAAATATVKSSAASKTFNIKYRYRGPKHSVLVNCYKFTELNGGSVATFEFPRKNDEFDAGTADSGWYVKTLEFTAPSNAQSFSITFKLTEPDSIMDIDYISVVDEISDAALLDDDANVTAYIPLKQWTFNGAPLTSSETGVSWIQENDNWWNFDSETNSELFSGTKDHSLWVAEEISLYDVIKMYSVPADSEYQLRKGDYITFFWRESDDDTAPYVYQSYKGVNPEDETDTNRSPVISPSFVLNGVRYADAKVKPDLLKDTGTIPYGDPDYYIVNQFYGDNDLSGTKEIKLRGMNQLQLKQNKHLYYFVTNDISDGKYNLPMKFNGTSKDGYWKYRYSLGPDEYFIYTDGKKESFEILGSGTLIAMDVEPTVTDGSTDIPDAIKVLSVTQVNSDDIMNLGVSAIDDWKVPSGKQMFVREQQIHNLVNGDTLQIGIDTSKPGFTMLYDSGVTKEWKYASDNVNRPLFVSNADTIVNGFSVSYTNSGGTTTSLPAVHLNGDDAQWVGRACLNIDCSASDPQKITPVNKSLQSMQSITVNDSTYPEQSIESLSKYVCTNTDADAEAESYYVESDVLVNKVGGTNVDISYVTLDGNRKDVNLYLYSVANKFNNEPFNRRDDGDIELFWSKFGSDNTKSVDVTLAIGDYILSVYNYSESQTFSITAQGASIECLSSPQGAKGRYYYKLSVTQKTFKMIFTKVDATVVPEATDVLIINSLFKFSPNNDFEGPYNIKHQQILDDIEVLDIENKFKYNYIVDEATRIDDPLESKKFFDANHIFNQNTVPLAELLLDSTGSYIHIVNNR